MKWVECQIVDDGGSSKTPCTSPRFQVYRFSVVVVVCGCFVFYFRPYSLLCDIRSIICNGLKKENDLSNFLLQGNQRLSIVVT